ncbi:unnamed protein product [Hapterophycus canaliculatus]
MRFRTFRCQYLPVLRKFPSKYIYEPWTAPKEVQRGCGCIIGKDYPKPIVDHKDVSKDNMSKMHDAYDAHQQAEAARSESDVGGGGNSGGGSSAPKKKAKR